MNLKRICGILSLCLLICSLPACSASWEGYENADMTKYITLGEYKGVRYTKAEISVTDEDVDKEIETVRADNMEKKELTDRVSQKNDYAIIDYTCTVDVGKISALSGTDQTFAVGSTYTMSDIEGFSDSLIGKSKGDSYTLTFTFPADYKNDKISDVSLVAGKEATFEITVDSVFEYVKPELTDEFVAKVSKTAKTVAEYREEIRAALTEQAEADAEAAMQEAVWTAVVEACKVIKYPEAELETYRTEMQRYYEEYASYYGYTLEQFLTSAYGYTLAEFETKKQEYAESSVLSDMVLYAIAKTENITVTDEEYQAGLQAYFELTGAELGIKTIEEFEEYYTKAVVAQSVLWDEVILFLCDEAIGVDAEASTETGAQT